MSNNSACLQDDNRYRGVTPFKFFLASFVTLIVEQI
jgi:hypothetical protein